jgi:uncharacterized membrane protein YbhN (UPF0104 family)
VRLASLPIRFVLGTLGTLLFVWLLASRVDLGRLTLHWDRRLGLGLVLAFLLITLAQWLSALRWRVILGRGAPPVGVLFRITLVGMFFGLFAPTSVGGDAVRAIYLSRILPGPARNASSVLLDRLLGLVALGLILAVGVALAPVLSAGVLRQVTWGRPPAWVGWLVAGGLCLAGAVAWRLLRATAWGREAVRLWVEFGREGARLRAGALVACGVQLSYVAAWLELAWALRLPAPAVSFLVFVPLVSLASMLPISISGLGLREGAWAVLLGPFGVAPADSVTFSLLYFALFALTATLGGALVLARPAGAPGPTYRSRLATPSLDPTPP